jgi:hypothetical protein
MTPGEDIEHEAWAAAIEPPRQRVSLRDAQVSVAWSNIWAAALGYAQNRRHARTNSRTANANPNSKMDVPCACIPTVASGEPQLARYRQKSGKPVEARSFLSERAQ